MAPRAISKLVWIPAMPPDDCISRETKLPLVTSGGLGVLGVDGLLDIAEAAMTTAQVLIATQIIKK